MILSGTKCFKNYFYQNREGSSFLETFIQIKDTWYFQGQNFLKIIFTGILSIGVKSIEIHPFSRQNNISGENLGVNQVQSRDPSFCYKLRWLAVDLS